MKVSLQISGSSLRCISASVFVEYPHKQVPAMRLGFISHPLPSLRKLQQLVAKGYHFKHVHFASVFAVDADLSEKLPADYINCILSFIVDFASISHCHTSSFYNTASRWKPNNTNSWLSLICKSKRKTVTLVLHLFTVLSLILLNLISKSVYSKKESKPIV